MYRPLQYEHPLLLELFQNNRGISKKQVENCNTSSTNTDADAKVWELFLK